MAVTMRRNRVSTGGTAFGVGSNALAMDESPLRSGVGSMRGPPRGRPPRKHRAGRRLLSSANDAANALDRAGTIGDMLSSVQSPTRG